MVPFEDMHLPFEEIHNMTINDFANIVVFVRSQTFNEHLLKNPSSCYAYTMLLRENAHHDHKNLHGSFHVAGTLWILVLHSMGGC